MQIEIKNVSKSFGKKQILKDVSLSASSGQCIGILGANGSGKSTLLSVLAGINKADSGEFLYDGHNLFDYEKVRAEIVGYVPQGTPLFEELSALDNLRMWYSKKSLKKELDCGILSILGINDFLRVPVYKMSGGMKKRLSIGCAVSTHPPILLLDEPMAALDLSCKKNISDYLKRHKSLGGVVFIVTHDVMEMELCDEYYIVKDGTVNKYFYNGDLDALIGSL